MDINNIPQTRINEIEQETVSQKREKPKDTEFQAEKGRDLLGMQGDSRHVLIKGESATNTRKTNHFDEIFDRKYHNEHIKNIINNWTKTSGSEEITLTIDGKEFPMHSFKSQAKDPRNGFNVAGGDIMYRLEPIKNKEEYVNMQIANGLYELLGFKTKNIQLAETAEGLYALSETFSLKGGFVQNDKDVAAKVYGINILLGNELEGAISSAKLDSNKTPVIMRPTLNFNKYMIALFKNPPATKNEVIMSLENVANLKDDDIIQIVKKYNPEKPEKLISGLLDRKRFITKFLENVKSTDQEGLPLKEFLEKIYYDVNAEEQYLLLQKTTDSSFTDFLQKEYNLNHKELLGFRKTIHHPELATYLKEKLQNGEISKDDLVAFTNSVIGETTAFGTFISEKPEKKIEISNILFDLNKNHNIPFRSGYLMVLKLAQNDKACSNIDTNAINSIKEISTKYGKNLPDELYYTLIKDGQIIPNAISIIETLKENNFDEKDASIITKQLIEKDGSISEPKLAKLKEILEYESSSDATAIFTAINTPEGFNEKLYPYIAKLQSFGVSNTDIAEIIAATRKTFKEKEIQADHALITAMEFANEKMDIKAFKAAIKELALFTPSTGQHVLSVLEKNKNIELSELTNFLKSTHSIGRFDQEGYLLGFELLKNGTPSKNLDKLITITKVPNDKSGAKTQELRQFAKRQLEAGNTSTIEVANLLSYVNPKSGLDNFAFNLIKNNADEISNEKLIQIILSSRIQTTPQNKNLSGDIEEQRGLIADFMLNLYKQKYNTPDVLKIISGVLNKERFGLFTYTTGVDKNILEFTQKCVEHNFTPNEINQLSTSLKINQNTLNLTPESLEHKNETVKNWVEDLLFEKNFSPKTASTLLNAVAMRNRMTRAIYDFDEKAISLLNQFIEDGIIKKDSKEDLSTIIKALKLYDYDNNVIGIIKKYLQEPITLENNQEYQLDGESLGVFIGSARNKETGTFDINKFNELTQLYILKSDYGFTIKEMQTLAQLYKKELDIHQIPTGVKVNLLTKLSYAPKEAIKLIEEKVIDTKNEQDEKVNGDIDILMDQLLTGINLASKSINTTQAQRQKVMSEFISNKGRNKLTGLNNIETQISQFNFLQFEKNGLPLKYSRADFIENLQTILADLTPEEQEILLKYHNIDLGENGFNSNPRIKRITQNVAPLTNQGYKEIITELPALLQGVNEDNIQLYKENTADTIIKKCIQFSQLDDTKIAEITKEYPELNVTNIKELQAQAIEFAKLVENNETGNLPTPLIVKIGNEEIETFEQFSPEMKSASAKIEEEYNKFIYENEFQTKDQELNNILNGIMKGMPDFMLTVGKQQHKTHAYSVDIHTMEVLKKAMNDPEYKTLSDQDRTILKFSILLHDFGKEYINPDTPDTGHERESAEIAKEILAQYKMPEKIKDRILNIIKNHDWFARYNKGELDANQVAAMFRSPDDYKIAKIMSKADLFSINSEFQYRQNVLNITENKTIEHASHVFDSKLKNLDIAYEKMYAKTNIIFNTKILNPKKIPMDEKYGVRVLNLADKNIPSDMDLGIYGMDGTTKDNLRLTVHMVAEDNLLGNLESAKLGMESTTNDNNVWSISLIKMDRTRAYMNREYGLITDTPISSIAIASPNNIGSGYEKGMDKFVELLFSNTSHRNILKNKFMQAIQSQGHVMDDTDYQELSKTIYNKQFFSQLETEKEIEINGKTYPTSIIVNAIRESSDSLFTGQTHSEIVATNPKIQGLVVRKENMEEVSPDFIAFAKKYNLPILLVGNKK